MSAIKTTCFIADLHLDPARSAEYQFALDFFNHADNLDELYILGDLFEYWIGDDAGLPMYKDVIASLALLSLKGCTVTVMLGNRDFLLADSFAKAASLTVYQDDELLIELDDEPVLLLHGDTLCTDDQEYQNFRHQVRDKHWQKLFLNKSINERMAYASQMREQSRTLSANKKQELMDVNTSVVTQRFAANQCERMIHGHTHRPAVHYDSTNSSCRMVVGDWHATYAQYVIKNAEGFHLKRLDRQEPAQ